MYDPALVALSLEVCSDALQAVQKSSNQTIAEPAPHGTGAAAWRQLNRASRWSSRRGRGAVRIPAGKGRTRVQADRIDESRIVSRLELVWVGSRRAWHS